MPYRQPYYQVVGENGFTPYRSGFGQVPAVQNRALGISPMLIQHRRDVMIPGPLRYGFGGRLSPVKLRTPEELKTADGGALLRLYGADPLATLAAIVASPSSQEVEEARSIDLFFRPVDMRQTVMGATAPPSYYEFVRSPTSPIIKRIPLALDGRMFYGTEAFSNPFLSLHPDVRAILVGSPAGAWNVGGFGSATIPGFLGFIAPEGWNVDASRPWGEVRTYVLNILALSAAMKAYPWPQPGLKYVPRFWLNEVKSMTGQLDPFLRGGRVLSSGDLGLDSIRTFITLSLTANYNNIMTRINNEMQREEERDARNSLIKSICMTVVAIMGGPVLGVVTAVGVAAQKVQAAKSMATMAEQFAATDAAFSAECKRVAYLLDAEAAQVKEETPPTPEETTALVEGAGVYEVWVEGQMVGTVKGDSEAATKLALEKSASGDRVEIFFIAKPGAEKVSLGLFIRTGTGVVKVPPEADAEVRTAQRQQLVDTVKGAEAKVTEEKGGGFPWWIVIPAAAMIL